MSERAYPLEWPIGWRRTEPAARIKSRFRKKVTSYRDVKQADGTLRRERGWSDLATLTVADGVKRVLAELRAMDVSLDGVVISSNIEVRRDGLPKSNRSAPVDPGVAVYWRQPFRIGQPHGKTQCMAIDMYELPQDNLAALAATLNAMRAIERHGGGTILDRALSGMIALPNLKVWWQVLGLSSPNVTREDVTKAHRRMASEHHPDHGGNSQTMADINFAREQGLQACDS